MIGRCHCAGVQWPAGWVEMNYKAFRMCVECGEYITWGEEE